MLTERYAESALLAVIVSIMSKSFKGEAEVKEHLNELINGKSSASKIKAACTLCLKHQQEYKLVVYEIEKFIKKVDISDKITSLYLLDAICRNSRAQVNNNKEKDIFSNRFAIRLKETLANLLYDSLSQADKLNCTKVFEEWRKKDIFNSELIPVTPLASTLQRDDVVNISSNNIIINNNNDYYNQPMQLQPPVYAPPQPPVFSQQPLLSSFPQQPTVPHTSRFNVAGNNEPLNTFNSMFNQQIQQQQQMFQHPPIAMVPPPIPPPHLYASPPVPPSAPPNPPGSKVDKRAKAENKVKVAPKMCPFKQSDGYKSCPFGEKCRFSHVLEWNPAESNLLQQVTKEKVERESSTRAAADVARRVDCVKFSKWQFNSLKRPLNDSIYDVEAINSFLAEAISNEADAKGILSSTENNKQSKVVRKKYASGNCADIVYSMDVTRVSMSCIDEELFNSNL